MRYLKPTLGSLVVALVVYMVYNGVVADTATSAADRGLSTLRERNKTMESLRCELMRSSCLEKFKQDP